VNRQIRVGMAMPFLVQALHMIQQDAVAQQLQRQLHHHSLVVARGPAMILVGTQLITASPTQMLAEIVAGTGLTAIQMIQHLPQHLPQHLSQQKIVALGMMRTFVLMVVNIVLPMLASVGIVVVTGCLPGLLRC